MNKIVLIGTKLYKIPLPFTGDGEEVLAEDVISYGGSVTLDIHGTVRSLLHDKEYTFEKAFAVSSAGEHAIILEPYNVHYWDMEHDVIKTHTVFDKEVTWGRMKPKGVYEVIAGGALYVCVRGAVATSVHNQDAHMVRVDNNDIIVVDGGFIYKNIRYDIGRTPKRVDVVDNIPLVLVDGELVQMYYDTDTSHIAIREIQVPEVDYIHDFVLIDNNALLLHDGGVNYINVLE